jgi:hypothetical protein
VVCVLIVLKGTEAGCGMDTMGRSCGLPCGVQGPIVTAGLPFDWHAPPRPMSKRRQQQLDEELVGPPMGLDLVRRSIIQVGRALGLDDTSSESPPSSL